MPCGTNTLAEHPVARPHRPVVKAPLLLQDHLPIVLQVGHGRLDAWGSGVATEEGYPT